MPGNSANKFNTPQRREAALLQVADMYLAGKTQQAIGDAIGVSRQQVSLYLRKLQQRWQAQAAEAIDARKARELARLDRVEREAWEGWERSCQAGETKVERTKTATFADDAKRLKITVPLEEKEYTLTSRGQAGDVGFLTIVMKCVETRMKIVGGFAPQKLEVYDWRAEAKQYGIDPDALVTDLFAKVPQVSGDGHP